MPVTLTTENPYIRDTRFGVEIEFTGISREAAATAIARAIEASVTHPRVSGGTSLLVDAQGRTWKVEADGSVTGSHYNRGGEFVTPVLRYEDMGTLQTAIRALRKAGAKVDSSCGIHVHVDGRGLTNLGVKHLTGWFWSRQEGVYQALGVESSRKRWCQFLPDSLQTAYRDSQTENLSDLWYQTLGSTWTRHDRRCSSRYHGLNLHSLWYRGTVEFRMFNASLHAGEVRSYVTFALAIVGHARVLQIEGKRASYRKCSPDSHLMWRELRKIGIVSEDPEFESVRKHLLKRVERNCDRARRTGQNWIAGRPTRPRRNQTSVA